MIKGDRLPLGIFGLVGSFAPTIVKMFNDLPNIAFVFKWELAAVVVLYGLLGGLISITYPYRGKPTPWKALLLGCGFPAIIGTATASLRPPHLGPNLGEGTDASWSIWDFISLF